ncbi:MAG: ABC transporter permease subunit [candidate division Zixibacteria bacterium]|nr:ABC transporter permease subunit [candidate division Zixibacteria bacterium]
MENLKTVLEHNMLNVIIEKEIREIIGSLKFAITFGACAVLIILSFYMGAKNYEISRTQYEAAKTENLRQLEGLTDWFDIEQHRIFLQPKPLASLVTGVSNDIGRTIEVTGRGELTANDSRFNDDLIYAVFRFLDLDFIFGFILSLFAILLGYNSISGEKEQGTLRLTFAGAVPRYKFILGKLIGSIVALVLPLLIAISLGYLLLIILGIPMGTEDWLRLSLIIVTGLLYAGVFLTLSVFISSLTRRSSHTFLLLLVVWIFGILIVPRASVLLAGRAVDVPSVDEISSQKNRYSSQLWQEDKTKMTGFKPDNSDDPEKMVEEFNRFMEKLADDREQKMMEFSSRLNEDRFNRQTKQQNLVFTLARISPATSMKLAATSLAGTSLDLKNHYQEEAMAYQQAYGKFIKEKTGINTGGRMIMVKMTMDDGEQPDPINPYDLPKFDYKPIPLSESVESSIIDMGILILYNLMFFAGAILAFGRYDVR